MPPAVARFVKLQTEVRSSRVYEWDLDVQVSHGFVEGRRFSQIVAFGSAKVALLVGDRLLRLV